MLPVQSKEPIGEDQWLRMRWPNINATEIHALFDCKPKYINEYELWVRKMKRLSTDVRYTGDHVVVDPEGNEAMITGRHAEPFIAGALSEIFGLDLIKDSQYHFMTLNEHGNGIGATPDYLLDGCPFEIKKVNNYSFRRYWKKEDGEVFCPQHIYLQVQQQILLTGATHGYVGYDGGEMHPNFIEVEKDTAIHDLIIERSKKFWENFHSGFEPFPESEDLPLVRAIHTKDRIEGEIDLTDDAEFAKAVEEHESLAQQLKNLNENVRELERIRDRHRAVIHAKLCRNDSAFTNLYNISYRVIPARTETRQVREQVRLSIKKRS